MWTRLLALVALIILYANVIYASPIRITFEPGFNGVQDGFNFSAWGPDYTGEPDAPYVEIEWGLLDGGIWVNNDDKSYIRVVSDNGAFTAFSLDARSPGAVLPGYYELCITIEGFDIFGNVVGTNGLFVKYPESFAWHTIDLAQQSFTNIYELRIYQGMATSCNYFDNLVLQAVPEPTTMVLFGTGLACLAARGSRRNVGKKGQIYFFESD